MSGRNHTVGGLFLPHSWAEWRQRNSLFSPFRPSPSSLLHPRSGGRKGPEGESEEVLNGKERRASGSVVFLAVSLPVFSEWSPSPSSTYCSTSLSLYAWTVYTRSTHANVSDFVALLGLKSGVSGGEKNNPRPRYARSNHGDGGVHPSYRFTASLGSRSPLDPSEVESIYNALRKF